jgi:hypothetical protein
LDTTPGPGYLDNDAFVAEIKRLPGDCAAAESLADRGKDLYSGYLESMKALDDKASTIVSFVGGGTGLIALASGSEKLLSRPALTPLIALAAMYLFAVLASGIAVQWPRKRGSVNVERLANVDVMMRRSGKSQLDALMGREYIEASRKAVGVVRRKAIFLTITQMCFAFGVAALVLNALIPTSAPPATTPDTKLHCTAAGNSFDCSLKQPKETK